MEALWSAIAFALGMSNSAQGGINSALGRRIGSWEGTSLSMFIGSMTMGLVILLGFSSGDLSRIFELPTYRLFLSGTIGCISTVCTMAAAPRIGVAACFLWRMAGQFSTAILVDTFGLLGAAKKAIGPYRIAGVILMFVGAIVMYSKKLGKKKDEDAEIPVIILFSLISILGGSCQALNSANGAFLTPIIGAFENSFLSFFVASIVAFIIRCFWKKKGDYKQLKVTPKWAFLGGVIGICNSVVQSLTTIALGVTLTTLYRNLGNMLFALIIDQRGWFEIPKIKITKERVAGIALMLAGVVVVNWLNILKLFA